MSIRNSSATVIGTFPEDTRLCGEGSRTIITTATERGPGGCDIHPFTPLWFNDSDSGQMEWHKDATTRRDMHQWVLTYSLTYGERLDLRQDVKPGMVVIRSTNIASQTVPDSSQSPVASTCVLIDRFTAGEHGLDVYGWQCGIETDPETLQKRLVAYHKDQESVYFWFNDSDTYWSMPLLMAADQQAPQPTSDELTRLTVEVADLKTRVAELEGENQRLTTRASNLDDDRARIMRQHAQDIQTIGERLSTEADKRGWCEEYDQIVADLNRQLHGTLPERTATYEFHLQATDLSHQVTVSDAGLTAQVTVEFSVSCYVTREIEGSPDDVDPEDLAFEVDDFNPWDIQIDDVEDFQVNDYDALRSRIYEDYPFSRSDFEVENYESA